MIFVKKDPLNYIKNHYHVPAKLNGRIKFLNDGRKGRIIGGSHYLHVIFDNEKTIRFLHPTWQIEYL